VSTAKHLAFIDCVPNDLNFYAQHYHWHSRSAGAGDEEEILEPDEVAAAAAR
jgi:hypothetical protein